MMFKMMLLNPRIYKNLWWATCKKIDSKEKAEVLPTEHWNFILVCSTKKKKKKNNASFRKFSLIHSVGDFLQCPECCLNFEGVLWCFVSDCANTPPQPQLKMPYLRKIQIPVKVKETYELKKYKLWQYSTILERFAALFIYVNNAGILNQWFHLN